MDVEGVRRARIVVDEREVVPAVDLRELAICRADVARGSAERETSGVVQPAGCQTVNACTTRPCSKTTPMPCGWNGFSLKYHVRSSHSRQTPWRSPQASSTSEPVSPNSTPASVTPGVNDPGRGLGRCREGEDERRDERC